MPTRGEAHPHSAETCCPLGMALWQGGGDGRKDLEVFLHQLVFLFGLIACLQRSGALRINSW